MICEIREDGREVVLRRPTLLDVLAMLTLLFRRDKEIVFTKPPSSSNPEQLLPQLRRKDGW